LGLRWKNLSRAVASAATLALGLIGPPALAEELPPATALIDWGVWVSPDGCMYWYADGGWDGFMEERVDPETGLPVCLEVNTCLSENTDTLFATDSAHLTPHGHQRLREFFASAGAFSYAIYGHTDSRASDEYNIDLSNRRARAVYEVAVSMGAAVDRVVGFGERRPIASNDTAAGMAQNRRVEVICYRW
jgi:outer membrane protein OmpA-like peptidoglycan-associated protein